MSCSFPRTVFLRSISEIKRAVSGRHSHDSTTKQNFKNKFKYLISSRIILDLNDFWSEEIKRHDTYFIKITYCNKCFLDFVNPASPSWSDEFHATCDNANKGGLGGGGGTMICLQVVPFLHFCDHDFLAAVFSVIPCRRRNKKHKCDK